MKRFKFLFLCILSVLIEYFLIFSFFFLIIKKLKVSLIIVGSIFLFMLILILIVHRSLNSASYDDKDEPYKEEFSALIDEFNQKYQKHIKLKYVRMPQPNPAWTVKDIIFINNDCPFDNRFRLGLLAHELGHGLSGLSRLTLLASLKPSNMISKLLFFAASALGPNIFGQIFKALYYLFSITQIIFIYPMMKKDEIFANEVAATLGFAGPLRCYYYEIKESDDPFIRSLDLTHPTPAKMIEDLNKYLDFSKIDANIYSYGTTLYRCELATKVFVMPDGLDKVDRLAFKNTQFIKIDLGKVETLPRIPFYGCSNLEEIVGLSLKEIKLQDLVGIKTLKVLKIGKDTVCDFDINSQNFKVIVK